MFRRLATRRAGFTLIEALVVIAIIGIVAAILLPTISKARMRARMTECMNNLKQIGMALQIYADDHGERYPTWPDPTGIEFTRSDSSTYSLDATYRVQLSSIDSPDLVLEKICLGALFPEFITDERVLDDPGGTVRMPLHALIDEENNVSQDISVDSGYFYVNGDFEIQGDRGPTGLGWLGFKITEPIVWCAEVNDPVAGIRRLPHRTGGTTEINCLYMDGHVARLEAPEGRPDEFIVRPLASPVWTVHDVLSSIKEVSGTYDQEYPP